MAWARRAVEWTRTRHRAVALTIGALALLLGAGYSALLPDEPRYWDEGEYYTYATNLSRAAIFSRDGITPSAFWPPGYPLLLAAGDLLGLGIPGLRYLNFVALALGIYFTYRLLVILHGPLAGVLGALLTLGYPVLLYSAGTLYPQILTFGLLAGVLFLLAKHRERDRVSWPVALAIGGLLGFAILTVTAFLVVLALVCAYTLASNEENRVRTTLVVGLTAVLLVGCWTVRNLVSMGAFIPISVNSGSNLLYGNSPNTTPFTGVRVDLSSIQQGFRETSEVGQDRECREAALRYMRENPGRTLILYVGKFLHWFHYTNRLATLSEPPAFRDLIMLATYGPILLLAILRVVLRRRIPVSRFEWLLVAIYIGTGLFYAIFFTRIRFRLPFEMAPISLAAILLAHTLERMTARKTAPAATEARAGGNRQRSEVR